MSQRQTKSPCHGGCYSHLRLAGVAGASRESRWCDLGESQVRLGQVAGATQESRWCDFSAAQGVRSVRNPRHLMRSPRICRRALLIGHLKANPKSKDAGRKCAEESAAFAGKARSAAKPAARPRTNRGNRASACDEVACVKTALRFNMKKTAPYTRSVSRLVARQAKGYMSEEKFRQGQGPLLPRNAVGDAALALELVQVGDVPVVVSHQGLLV